MLAFIPPNAEWELGKAFSTGASTYGDWNYIKGHKYSKLVSAAKRHINKAMRGFDYDEQEVSNFHLAHAVANLLILIEQQINGSIIDDRPYKIKK